MDNIKQVTNADQARRMPDGVPCKVKPDIAKELLQTVQEPRGNGWTVAIEEEVAARYGWQDVNTIVMGWLEDNADDIDDHKGKGKHCRVYFKDAIIYVCPDKHFVLVSFRKDITFNGVGFQNSPGAANG